MMAMGSGIGGDGNNWMSWKWKLLWGWKGKERGKAADVVLPDRRQ